MPLRDRIAHAIQVLAAALLIAAVGIMTVQVTLRTLFSAPMSWVEEVARYFFVWAVYLGSIVAVTRDTHIRVLVAVEPFGAVGKRISDALSWLVNVFCFGFLAYWGTDLAWKYRGSEFYTLPGVPQIIFYLSVPVSMTIMLAFLVLPGRRHGPAQVEELPPGL
jgi:TRAP-type C4-dicarboxylate transport system permease small subunit